MTQIAIITITHDDRNQKLDISLKFNPPLKGEPGTREVELAEHLAAAGICAINAALEEALQPAPVKDEPLVRL